MIKEILNIEEADINTWVVPYGNLMTILMIFFLVLYAFTYISSSKEEYEKTLMTLQEEMGGFENRELYEKSKSIIEKAIIKDKETKAADEMGGLFERADLKQFANLQITEQRIKIIFESPVLFDMGTAELKPETIWILQKIAEVTRDMPNEVIIEGHTDNVPIVGGKYRSNWELSLTRAFSVLDYFVEVEGLDPKRFSAVGYGEYRPIFPNDTEEHRAENRRIEISILRAET